MTQFREVIESEQNQGVDETIAWQIRTFVKDADGNYVNPSSVSLIKAYSVINGTYTDVSATALSGSSSLSGRVITLPSFGNAAITQDVLYRIEVKYLVSGNILEDFIMIRCRR